MIGDGFQRLVAWRYLMSRPRRVSRVALGTAGFFAAVAVACALVATFVIHKPDPRAFVPDGSEGTYFVLLSVGGGCLGLAAICLVFGVLRYFFTFFTTVPIGGVWIGTMALVIVLSVMSGFENDLEGKILGSNAHIQVTKTEPDVGDPTPFLEWKDVKAKLDRVHGVVASMPFVTSEAVIAANNNYATVIIKGIDPESVGKVTNLAADLVDEEPFTIDDLVALWRGDREALIGRDPLERLYPLVTDDIVRPQVAPPPAAPTGAIDPAPSDMPGGAAPVDFSGQGQVVDPAPGDFGAPVSSPAPIDLSAPLPAPDAEPHPATTPGQMGSGSGSGAGSGSGSDYGGDAPSLLGPIPGGGLGGAHAGSGGPLHILSVPIGSDAAGTDVVIDDEGPREAGRTASLPGLLIGKELVKTIHMYTGEEVRVVSPLSDPANPDATGTPIPFNRDYRVAGVFYTGMYEYDLKYVYVQLESLQQFLDLGDAVDGIEVRLENPNATEDVGAAISQAIGPGYTVRDWKDLNRNLFSALKLEKIAMFLVLAITILVASFSIIGNLIMVVVEKAKEIALLKTLGASDRGVMFLFVTQGFFIGLVGTLMGMVTGLGLCLAASHWGLPLNPDVYYIDRLPIHIEPGSVMAIAAAGIVISVAATIYPAFVAARLRPAQGLRND